MERASKQQCSSSLSSNDDLVLKQMLLVLLYHPIRAGPAPREGVGHRAVITVPSETGLLKFTDATFRSAAVLSESVE